MQPEKIEDWKKSLIHPPFITFTISRYSTKKARYMTSEKSATSVVAKKLKKNDLLVAKLRKFTKYEGHGSSKFDRNRSRFVYT